MSALVCPKCGASYRKGFDVCHACKVALVDAATYAAQKTSRGKPRDVLAGKKTATFIHAGLQACREIERALLERAGLAVVEFPTGTDAAAIPLSFAQRRLWFFDQLQPGQTAYHIPAVWRGRGARDGERLERSVTAELARH